MSLEPCPSSPNCVSSQSDPTDDEHYMQAIDYTGTAEHTLDAVAQVLGEASGASVTNRTEDRIDAVFVTRIFRFKDDVSFLVDPATQKLHFRSASRVGHSDLGANRKRLTALLPKIKAKM